MPNSTLISRVRTSQNTWQNQNISIWVTSNDLAQLENKLKIEFEQKIQQQQSKSLDILAIFITLFTFISVNITIFQKVDNEKAVYFMLLITWAMITSSW
jgi:K+-sensing histidine kinase KdpD